MPGRVFRIGEVARYHDGAFRLYGHHVAVAYGNGTRLVRKLVIVEIGGGGMLQVPSPIPR